MALLEKDAAVDGVSEIVEGFWRARVLSAAAQLGIPDAMGEGPATSEDLAARIGADPRALFRLMRALAALGVCAHRGGTEFELTEEGRKLRSDAPTSKFDHAAHIGAVVWRMFEGLDEMVRKGGSAIGDDAAGFEDLSTNPAAVAAFQTSLERESLELTPELLEVFDFSEYRTVVDVGGGYGGLVQGLLKEFPDMRGQVVDLPVLAEDAGRRLAAAGLGGRAEFVGGDFFEELPAGADAYLLKFILHDWDDDHSVRILESCRKAAGANGAVLIIERVVPERVEAEPQHAFVIGYDLVMMTYGGRERTVREYAELMSRAGLTMYEVAHAGEQGHCIMAGMAASSGPEEARAREREAETRDRATT